MLQLRFVLAVAAILAYLFIAPGASPMRVALGGEALTLRFAFANPVAWGIFVLALLIAWGVWRRFAWAWWLGVAAAGVQLGRLVWWVAQHHSLSRPPGSGTWIVAGLLAGFLVVMLSPGVRASCRR